jgi:hypothetical protein
MSAGTAIAADTSVQRKEFTPALTLAEEAERQRGREPALQLPHRDSDLMNTAVPQARQNRRIDGLTVEEHPLDP